jgi:uncharacterized protein YbjQ (UPF0145 family)
MTTKEQAPAPPIAAPVGVDWREVARSALGSAFLAGLIGGALHVLGRVIEAEARTAVERMRDAAGAVEGDAETAADAGEAPHEEEHEGDDLDEAAEAARLLGVGLDASESEIRAALRARLTDSRMHPDHGGDGEEAKRLIAARNLLVERARMVRP